jgi:hypothetical protein
VIWRAGRGSAVLGALTRTMEPVVVEEEGRAVAVLVSPDEFAA